jgi:hypothetical protein
VAIEITKSHRGLLHEEMGIPSGKKISIGALMAKKAKDKREGNTAGEKRDVFAISSRKWNK